MKKRMIAIVAVLPFLFNGCLDPKPPNGDKPNWDVIGPKIQARVKYVAMFAFTMDQVQPYKAQVCTTADQIVDFLKTYDDPEASLGAVRAAVMSLVNQIEDINVRNAVMIFVDMVLTESFNYAWEHYSNWIELDEVKTVIIIARAVGNGIKDACDLTMSVTAMSNQEGHYMSSIFTIPHKIRE
jgi:hypothetical protein